ARPAVERERHRPPRAVFHVVAGVGDEKDGRARLFAFRLAGRLALLLRLFLQHDRAGRHRAADDAPADSKGVLGDREVVLRLWLAGFLVGLGGFVFIFFVGVGHGGLASRWVVAAIVA